MRSPFREMVQVTFLPKSAAPLKVCSIDSRENAVYRRYTILKTCFHLLSQMDGLYLKLWIVIYITVPKPTTVKSLNLDLVVDDIFIVLCHQQFRSLAANRPFMSM